MPYDIHMHAHINAHAYIYIYIYMSACAYVWSHISVQKHLQSRGGFGPDMMLQAFSRMVPDALLMDLQLPSDLGPLLAVDRFSRIVFLNLPHDVIAGPTPRSPTPIPSGIQPAIVTPQSTQEE